MTAQPSSARLRSSAIAVLVGVALLIGVLMLLCQSGSSDGDSTEFDDLVVVLRENRNRLQVHHLEGEVTTIANTLGGWGKILHGQMKVRQPWSVNYYADMGDLSLDDYIWDEATRTLLVRAPPARPDAPNIDETKQAVSYAGPIITRDMQTRLRGDVARGARKQVVNEAAKPENLAAANRAAREAIARNITTPLKAAGIRNVSVVVRMPTDGSGNRGQQWDLSRTISEVLAERAGR